LKTETQLQLYFDERFQTEFGVDPQSFGEGPIVRAVAQTAREGVEHDPQQGGALFVFTNQRATRLELLLANATVFLAIQNPAPGSTGIMTGSGPTRGNSNSIY
jgi:hypothetical protein